jgi:micrococcal nuclease
MNRLLRHLAIDLCSLAIGLGAVTPAAAAKVREIVGTVTRVADGDSLTLVPASGGQPVRVRLQGIDAPEGCQPWGAEAGEALRELVQGQTVTVLSTGLDDHGRTLGKVMKGPFDVGDRLVRDGHAWSYRFRNDRGPYVAQERMAQALRRGLHAEGGAVMPREFRKRNGPCQGDAPVVAPSGARPGVAGPSGGLPAGAPDASPARPAPSRAGTASTTAPVAAPTTRAPAAASSSFRCDGRIHCSQMTSCAEATYFLQHCPGTRMDGNNDGVPCERQWCN